MPRGGPRGVFLLRLDTKTRMTLKKVTAGKEEPHRVGHHGHDLRLSRWAGSRCTPRCHWWLRQLTRRMWCPPSQKGQFSGQRGPNAHMRSMVAHCGLHCRLHVLNAFATSLPLHEARDAACSRRQWGLQPGGARNAYLV